MGQDQTEQASGISNVAYDLMSVLQNTLEGISALQEYKEDAEEAGDDEVLQLFESIEERLSGEVDQLRSLLRQRL